MGHESYLLRWLSDERVAVAAMVPFNFAWTDYRKRYLRAVSMQCDNRQFYAQLALREGTGIAYRRDIFLDAAYSVHWNPYNRRTIYSWTGDQPFKQEVRVHGYNVEVGDELLCVLQYEEPTI